jgi:hypothetical protein
MLILGIKFDNGTVCGTLGTNDPEPPQPCNCNGAKIASVYMVYNGSPCSAGNNAQSGKATCSGSIGSTTNTLVKAGSAAGGSQWFSGTLSVGQNFTIKASNGGATKLGTDTY